MKIGTHIPSFSLEDNKRNWFNSDEFLYKKNMVLFFYPKDFTPVCTKEVCVFRDFHEKFADLDALILGINNQSPKTHEKFAEKHRLKFPLLSDKKGLLYKRFGLKKKWLFFYPRETFVFNKKGRLIAHIRDAKNPQVHIDQALEALRNEQKKN
ncbi:peroxiredoxin [uncultured Weeksella sp.]|uniref:peroxiredoxin n=1 Tax=uncultured Weeksella sp. TaxID=1161389 RepID=UPI00259BA010|nr:peroxiredoxin [uncultured Weeksella sp.]